MFKMTRTAAAAVATVLAGGGLALAAAIPASASTHACDIAGIGCSSLNTEVPGLPDLDALGGSALSGNSLIVFTRSATDKAEDFVVQSVPDTTVPANSVYPSIAVHAIVGSAVRIQYAPKGVLSGLCVSSVNPNGFAATQLRNCAPVGKYNPFQTFDKRMATSIDSASAFTYAEIINGHLLTDPRNNGDLGVVGARVHVITTGTWSATPHTGQLWSANGA